MHHAILKLPGRVWSRPMTAAAGPAGRLGRGAHRPAGPVRMAEGMRVIVRKERPHPGAQLRFTDIDGHRFTCFATDARPASSPTWNYATAAAPAARTGSAAPKTPACATCPCTATPRTRSGARSWPWPANCSPGCRCSPWTAPPGLGTQAAAAAHLQRRRPPRPQRPPAAAAPLRPLALGHPDHRRHHPPARPRTRLASRTRPRKKGQPRARGTPSTRHDSRATRYDHTLKTTTSHHSRPPKITKDRG